MEIGKLIYPGFNRSFEELSSIKVKKGNLIEIVDLTDIFVFRYNGAIWQEVGRTLNIQES